MSQALETFYYDNRTTRNFLLATVLWGLIGLLVGLTIALQLVFPALNADTSWLTFGRLRALHTNGPVSGAFRGFGVPQATALQETLIDQLAEQAGFDPLEFRLRNALAPGDATTCGQKLTAPGIRECLLALRPHWQRARAATAAAKGRARGVGLACGW